MSINRMEAEWLRDANLVKDYIPIVSIAYNNMQNIDFRKIDKINIDSLLDVSFYFTTNFKSGLITNDENDFFYFQHENGRYSLICGDCEFVNIAYK